MTKPGLDLISVAVDDLQRTAAFYRDGLGWPAERVSAGDVYVKIDLDRGLSLLLYEREFFTRQFGQLGIPDRAGGMVLSMLVASEAEVAAVVERAAAAGGKLPAGQPQAQAWGGFAGYFADPDGLVWEVIAQPADE
ncbi:VOC family protein [Geminicoccus harenae]|uniref:VOC family protein n=1 Tax=Geminicoccus harenae TaxID=2498453 RepID=UPI00168A67B0|nr:VOC family protein [Geminicoccus harenae]